jgi:hypothetical protein
MDYIDARCQGFQTFYFIINVGHSKLERLVLASFSGSSNLCKQGLPYNTPNSNLGRTFKIIFLQSDEEKSLLASILGVDVFKTFFFVVNGGIK